MVKIRKGQISSDKTYVEAVNQGHYNLYKGGLSGKYDNVRIYWEDQVRGMFLKSHIQRLVNRKRKEQKKIRIIDLGAGTGEGLRLITSWNRKDVDLNLDRPKVLPWNMIECYMGIDLCESMVNQGNENFKSKDNVTFRIGDFSKGLPAKESNPFDIYFCSYSSYSHISSQDLEQLFIEMVEHIGDRALLVGDWLGRHSIEWPCYWNNTADQMLNYSMSWINEHSDMNKEPDQFTMRYWIKNELQTMIQKIEKQLQVKINILNLFDVSLLVGRHVDTKEYNDWIRPLRSVVNRLFEPNVRTDLSLLEAKYETALGFDELNQYFESLTFLWNSLIHFCWQRFEKRVHPLSLKNWRTYSPSVQRDMLAIDRLIDSIYWMQLEDPRANLIEPQLAFSLRNLETEHQNGNGRGHALVGIFEVIKNR